MREEEKGQTCVWLRCVYLGVDVVGVCRGRVCRFVMHVYDLFMQSVCMCVCWLTLSFRCVFRHR